MTMQTAPVSPNPVSQALSAPPPRGAPVDTQVDAFSAALKAADQTAGHTKKAAMIDDKPAADDGTIDPTQGAAKPLDPQWMANFAAMVGHLQPPVQPVPNADTAGLASGADGTLPPALTGVTAAPADAQDESLTASDDAALAELADSTSSSPRSKRSAGVAAASDTAASASAKSAPTGVSGNALRGQETEGARMQAPIAVGAAPVSFAAKTAELHADAVVSPSAATDTAAAADSSAPTPGAPTHAPGTQATLARAEVPTIPGAATSLHGQALQGRLDDALRWMAGNGVQTAQIKVTPEELGPITVHLQLSGDTAHVMFSSAHEHTRQVLESSLAGLRDALAAGGLSLGQASVGSEQQQRNLFAGTESGERRPSDSTPAFAMTDSGTENAGAAVAAQRAPSATRQGNGLVNLYA